MTTNIHSLYKTPTFLVASNFLGSSSSFQTPHQAKPFIRTRDSKSYGERLDFGKKIRGKIICGALLPVDPWAPTIDSESIASQLFAVSLFPYIGFLYFITKSKSAPKLTLFGFYFLLTFVGATIPAGIYAKVHYGTALSNLDWLHGGAESLLTLTNLFIVMGLREALRETRDEEQDAPDSVSRLKEKKEPSI